MNEEDKLSAMEIITIFYLADEVGNKLSKEQIMLIHYSIRNQREREINNNHINNYKRINLFSLCDYDQIFDKLLSVDIITRKFSSLHKPRYAITAKGKKIFNSIYSSFLGKILGKIQTLFKEDISEDNLRKVVLPQVRIIK